MSATPKLALLETSASIYDAITPEIYLYLTTIVLADAVQNIFQPENCIICQDTLSQRSEGEILHKDRCWYYKTPNPNDNYKGTYFCKKSGGILITPDTAFTSNGVLDFKPPQQTNNAVFKELSELPFNIIGNHKNIMTVVTSPQYITLNIDVPGYAQPDIKIILSKTSFNDYSINIFMDNKLKGPKELSFNLAAEIYSFEDYMSTCSISNGLLTLIVQRRPSFGTKSIHIQDKNSPGIPVSA